MDMALPLEGPQLFGKVLLVEDDPIAAEWIAKKVSRAGMVCKLVHSKEEASICIKNEVFHAVITDLYFENGQPTGLELVNELEALGIPVVVISSRADLKVAKDAVNSGASFLLEKPFEPEELIEALRKVWEEPRGQIGIVERFLDQNSLTQKEKEIVRLILKGLSNKEIAEVSGNTEKTIKFHLTTIFQKCGVASRTELFNAVFPT